MKRTLAIYRFDGTRAYWSSFALEIRGKTVLDCLKEISSKHEPSLAFRAECRSGMCGCCALQVNGQYVLSCKAFIADLAGSQDTDRQVTKPAADFIIEPLDYDRVIRDLVVDEKAYIESIRSLEPWADEGGQIADQYRQQDCIVCGICDSSVDGDQATEVSLTGLVKTSQFVYSKAKKKGKRAAALYRPEQLEGIDQVCPKGITIERLYQDLTKEQK